MATKPNEPMVLARHAKILVGNGKPRTASIDPVTAGHYQTLPPGITIKYTHEANGLCRTVSTRDHTVCHKHQLALSHILLRRPGGPIRPTWHIVPNRGLSLTIRHGGDPATLTPTWPYDPQRPKTQREA